MTSMDKFTKLDVLAIAAHPDDAELGCGGTLAKMAALGYKTGVLDLTKGELGTRGSVEKRHQEATKSAEILKLSFRGNLGLPDGFLANTEAQRLAIISALRSLQPEIVFINAPQDRHPDHGNGAVLAKEACFLAGLAKIETVGADGKLQEAWRPKKVWHYIQDQLIMPDFVVDISGYFEAKMAAIQAFDSQFFSSNGDGPQTYISSPDFLPFVEARAREMGHLAGVTFGEGFISDRPILVHDPMQHKG